MRRRSVEEEYVIYRYTRKQAIEDGVLIDVSETAREAGIIYPVAITGTVLESYIVPSEKDRANGQSEKGRLWDVLWIFRNAAKQNAGDILLFKVYFTLFCNQELVTLKAICGPGDEAEPVITIMLPEED